MSSEQTLDYWLVMGIITAVPCLLVGAAQTLWEIRYWQGAKTSIRTKAVITVLAILAGTYTGVACYSDAFADLDTLLREPLFILYLGIGVFSFVASYLASNIMLSLFSKPWRKSKTEGTPRVATDSASVV